MKFIISLALLGLVVVALAEKVRYDNYKVYRVTPQNEEERAVLMSLEENNPGVTFWKSVRSVGLPVDIMIPPHLQHDIVAGITGKSFKTLEMVTDVQSLIDAEAIGSLNASPKLSFDAYYGVDDIYAFLDEVAANTSYATVASFGTSYEGRDLKYLTLAKGPTKKPLIFVDANIHAREWITNAITTYLVNELINPDNTEVSGLLDTFDFVIIPVLNVDGYEYSRSTDRMWRKTRSNLAGGLCRGADPNRNFGFQWGTGGSSASPCSDTYMGVSAFSEPETAAASKLMDSLADDIVFYLSLHSYSQLILIPFGNDMGHAPDHDEHMRVGNIAKAAIARRYNTQFTPGNIVDLLYVASGASVDYMKGEHDAKSPLTYTFEMRDTGVNGFILPPAQIVPSSLEFLDGLLAICAELKKKM